MDAPLDTSALLRLALLYPLVQHAFFGLTRAIHPGELSEVLLACGNVGFVGFLVSQLGPDLRCHDTKNDTGSE
jgi:hypothetical protein